MLYRATSINVLGLALMNDRCSARQLFRQHVFNKAIAILREHRVRVKRSLVAAAIVLFSQVIALCQERALGQERASGQERALQRKELQIDGNAAFIIVPKKGLPGPTPWVFYAPTLRGLPGTEENWMFRQFLEVGMAIAGIDVGESYGSPLGRAIYNVMHEQLVAEYGLDTKACLLARSRGGLMLYNWAVENPEKVKCIVGIYPVCSLESYPGLQEASRAYGMTEKQLAVNLAQHNPIDRLAPLAQARVPIFHIHGDIDKVVPLETNSALFARRYEEAGGKMKLKIARGQGHTMWKGFFECQELVDFVIEHATADMVGADKRAQEAQGRNLDGQKDADYFRRYPDEKNEIVSSLRVRDRGQEPSRPLSELDASEVTLPP